MEKRIVKVPLPVSQIRRMDELISSKAGGFESRGEFVHEAIEGLILELTYEDAPPQSGSPAPAEPVFDDPGMVKVSPGEAAPASIDMTLLKVPSLGVVHDDGFSTGESGIMFGLHNRDYPSLWGLFQLAQMTQAAPIPFGEFIDEVVRRGWEHGKTLSELDQEYGGKLAVLFPTNRDKPIAAADRFRVFGLGGFQERDGSITTGGPLFRWGVAGLVDVKGGLYVAPTSVGYDLMEALDGMRADWPHDQRHAAAFLTHLRRLAPDDAAGFLVVLKTFDSGASREELLEAFTDQWPEQVESEISVNAQAYVARCREWGLVEPKQVRRRYALTEYGIQYLSQVEGETK